MTAYISCASCPSALAELGEGDRRRRSTSAAVLRRVGVALQERRELMLEFRLRTLVSDALDQDRVRADRVVDLVRRAMSHAQDAPEYRFYDEVKASTAFCFGLSHDFSAPLER